MIVPFPAVDSTLRQPELVVLLEIQPARHGNNQVVAVPIVDRPPPEPCFENLEYHGHFVCMGNVGIVQNHPPVQVPE